MNQRKSNSDALQPTGKGTMSRRSFVGAATAATLLGGAGGSGLGAQTPEHVTASGATLFSRFITLPPGSIAPEGWLLRYAQINADG